MISSRLGVLGGQATTLNQIFQEVNLRPETPPTEVELGTFHLMLLVAVPIRSGCLSTHLTFPVSASSTIWVLVSQAGGLQKKRHEGISSKFEQRCLVLGKVPIIVAWWCLGMNMFES